MIRSLRRLDVWFARPAPPERLAVFRVLLGTFTLGYLLIRLPVFLSLADGRPSRFEPVGLLSVLDGPLPSGLVKVVVFAALASAVAFAIGRHFRIAGPTLAVLMLILGTYRSSWGQLLHFENLLVLHLLVVGLSPAADAYSLDRRSAQRRSGAADHDVGGQAASVRYGWPLQVAAIVTTVTYVLAGFAKLRYGGVDWMLGDTLRNHVAYSATRLDLLGGNPSPLAESLVGHRWLFPPLATATVIIELAAPLALLWPPIRRAWVISTWLMHVGILGLMFIVFPYPLFGLAFAPLYNLERLVPDRSGRADHRELQ